LGAKLVHRFQAEGETAFTPRSRRPHGNPRAVSVDVEDWIVRLRKELSKMGPRYTCTTSRLALWWIDVHPPGEAFVVTTAPTTPQVEAILWRYMGNAHKKGGLPGRITLDAKWYIGNELVAYGRKPADYDPAVFQGIHARYVLVIIDEAGSVPKSIFDAVDALATNIDARVVAVGNPDDPAFHFATICKPGSGWHVETISAFDTPAYTGEKVLHDLLPLLVSPEWVEERKLRWGVTSPIY
jgi:hypothetical protein